MKKMQHIATIKATTKKGNAIETRWHVSKSHPYPCIYSTYGLSWQNTEGLIPQYGSRDKTPTIGNTYRCFLLRSDFDPATATGNRNDFAGFSPGLVYDNVTGNRIVQPELPGSIEYRGKSLGEMSVVFGNNPEYPDIKVRGSESPTPSEREFIKAEIIPALRSFIAENSDSLHLEAINSLLRNVKEKIDSAKKELEAAESKMLEIIKSL